MFPRLPLGGFDTKYAGAYLLPPTVKPKKKKKTQPDEDTLETLAKEAAAAQDAINDQQARMRQQFQSGGLGGWNPYNQIQSDN